MQYFLRNCSEAKEYSISNMHIPQLFTFLSQYVFFLKLLWTKVLLIRTTGHPEEDSFTCIHKADGLLLIKYAKLLIVQSVMSRMPTEQHRIIHIYLSEGRMWNCQEEISKSEKHVQKAVLPWNINVAVILEMSIILTKTDIEISPERLLVG